LQLERALETEAGGIREAVLSGACDDYASYKYLIGKIIGIQFAIRTLKEMEEAELTADSDF
jgi:hypothetical protein